MNHDELKNLLLEYFDGELQDRRAAEVKAHAAVCPECAARLEELAFASRAAASALKRPAGEEFENAVMAGVRARQVPAPARRLFPRVDAARHFIVEVFGLRRLALAGACAAALTVAVFYGYERRAPAVSPGSAAAACELLAYGGGESYSYGASPSLNESYEQYFLSNTLDTTEE